MSMIEHRRAVCVPVNVPAVSFGLAVGWVSLASGQAGGDGVDDAQAVVAAGTTYLASLAGVPLCARALAAGRKPAVIATSAAFVVIHDTFLQVLQYGYSP